MKKYYWIEMVENFSSVFVGSKIEAVRRLRSNRHHWAEVTVFSHDREPDNPKDPSGFNPRTGYLPPGTFVFIGPPSAEMSDTEESLEEPDFRANNTESYKVENLMFVRPKDERKAEELRKALGKSLLFEVPRLQLV